MFTYSLLAKDPLSAARLGTFTTMHGTVKTPVFMPVGTQATVKTLSPADLSDIGVAIILANTYHLFLRLADERFMIVANASNSAASIGLWHGTNRFLLTAEAFRSSVLQN